MKIIQADKDRFEFEVSREEKELLNVLQQYPVVPASHHRLSRGRKIPNREENQQLLDESLKAQRRENRRLVAAFLNAPERFVKSANCFRLVFVRSEVEWLLQVLNDIRVGSWLALGSPAEPMEVEEGMSAEKISLIINMDIAAFFQMVLLKAVSGDIPRHE